MSLETVHKKLHLAHIGASFSNLQKPTEKQLNYSAYVPINSQ